MSDTNLSQSPTNAESRPAGRDEVIEAAIQAATELFATHNPTQVSVREIAARAGVSHALVHRYLGSKDDIFRTVLERDRQETARFWMENHGMSTTASTFAPDLPPGRYLRTAMRAILDGTQLSPADIKFPHADRMLQLLESGAMSAAGDEAVFDPRVLFSAMTAMTAGMALAEDFFLVQSGLEGEDREKVRAEINRLMAHIMTLAEPPRT